MSNVSILNVKITLAGDEYCIRFKVLLESVMIDKKRIFYDRYV